MLYRLYHNSLDSCRHWLISQWEADNTVVAWLHEWRTHSSCLLAFNSASSAARRSRSSLVSFSRCITFSISWIFSSSSSSSVNPNRRHTTMYYNGDKVLPQSGVRVKLPMSTHQSIGSQRQWWRPPREPTKNKLQRLTPCTMHEFLQQTDVAIITKGAQLALLWRLDMSQLWWLQRNGRRSVGHNDETDLKPFLGQRSRKVGQRLGDIVDWH